MVATLTTLTPQGVVHVVPIAFTWDPSSSILRLITDGRTRKVRNIRRGSGVTVCQHQGRRWLSLTGPATVLSDPNAVRHAEQAHAFRYGRHPQPNANRVVVMVSVTNVLGDSTMFVTGSGTS